MFLLLFLRKIRQLTMKKLDLSEEIAVLIAQREDFMYEIDLQMKNLEINYKQAEIAAMEQKLLYLNYKRQKLATLCKYVLLLRSPNEKYSLI